MDATIFWLGIITICCSIFMIVFSVRKIIKESRRDRERLSPSGHRTHWYTNVVIRKEVGTVFYMGALLPITAGFYLISLEHDVQSSSLFWLLIAFFALNAISRLYTTFSEEHERRFIARSAGETPKKWWSSFELHRGLAAASFWIGLPLPWFLIGWDVISSLSSNPMNVCF